MGMAHACRKYGKCANEKAKDLAGRMKPKDIEDFARTQHAGLPERKDKTMKKESTTFAEYVSRRDKELNEVGTSTADIAIFQRRAIPSMVNRLWPDSVDEFFKKKKDSRPCWSCGDKK